MSEVITINTAENIVQTRKIEPLSLYDEDFYMLRQSMPEYRGTLPNNYVNNLVERMRLTMSKFNGLGLSANQCGVEFRGFLIGTDQFQIFCINPKVLSQSANLLKDNEGCLSFPGLFCKIERPDWVEVEFTAETGETKQMRLEGLTARCFLHELDHLNGVKFVDRIGPVALQMARKKQSKLIKRVMRNK